MLKFQRFAHTRAKKVTVQLLKDFGNVGHRGEVVQVTEGLMRNKLHPENGAVYILEGQPLRIPLVRRQLKEKRPASAPENKPTEKSKPKKPSMLDSLVFEPHNATVSQVHAAAGTAMDEAISRKAAETGLKHSLDASKSLRKEGEKVFEWENEFVSKLGKR